MRVAIAEDDRFCAQQMQDYLSRFAEENAVAIDCRVFSTGTELLATSSGNWDLILLDIEMPEMDGMTTARHIREQNEDVVIVFITQLAQYAINGYEVGALDYLLKPVGYPLFSAKMRRIIQLLSRRQPHSVTISSGGATIRLYLEQLYYIEIRNHTLTYHTVNGNYSATGSKTIRTLEIELAPYGLFRCNQCYLVNLRYVTQIVKDSVMLQDGAKLTVSRSRRKAFLQALAAYWGGGRL